MLRGILGAILATGLALPSVALARQTTGLNTNEFPGTSVGTVQNGSMLDRHCRPHAEVANGPQRDTLGSLGGGAVGGNEPGHVDSPGATKIDPDSRGPINDVQPGRGTTDTRQNMNPPPAR